MGEIVIDTQKWQTIPKFCQSVPAKFVTSNTIYTWVKRDQIETWYIEELDITLINVESAKNKIAELRKKKIENFLKYADEPEIQEEVKKNNSKK